MFDTLVLAWHPEDVINQTKGVKYMNLIRKVPSADVRAVANRYVVSIERSSAMQEANYVAKDLTEVKAILEALLLEVPVGN
jgi:hypothetical protein